MKSKALKNIEQQNAGWATSIAHKQAVTTHKPQPTHKKILANKKPIKKNHFSKTI
jgi:hypothetical protein